MAQRTALFIWLCSEFGFEPTATTVVLPIKTTRVTSTQLQSETSKARSETKLTSGSLLLPSTTTCTAVMMPALTTGAQAMSMEP